MKHNYIIFPLIKRREGHHCSHRKQMEMKLLLILEKLFYPKRKKHIYIYKIF